MNKNEKLAADVAVEFAKEKRTDLTHIDPRLVKVEEGHNARQDFEGLEELVESIRAVGIQTPLKGYREKGERADGTPYDVVLIAGERRLRSVLTLIREGIEIRTIPMVLVKKPTETERIIQMIVENEHKQLNDYEKALGYKKLINYGWTQSEIAAKIGKNPVLVSSCLALLNMPAAMQQAMQRGDIAPQAARQINKEVGADTELAALVVADAVNTAKAAGKKTATAKHIDKTVVGDPDCKKLAALLTKFIAPVQDGNNYYDMIIELTNELNKKGATLAKVADKMLEV